MTDDAILAILRHTLDVAPEAKTVTLTRDVAARLHSRLESAIRQRDEMNRALVTIHNSTTRPGTPYSSQLPCDLSRVAQDVAILCAEAWQARGKKEAP